MKGVLVNLDHVVTLEVRETEDGPAELFAELATGKRHILAEADKRAAWDFRDQLAVKVLQVAEFHPDGQVKIKKNIE